MAQRFQTAAVALDERAERFLTLRARYGSRDVGLFALYLFNLIHLDAGEGIFTQAGVPHAYLEGTLIECMANSDNVVRVGLTPKYRDAQTLLEIVDPTPGAPDVLTGTPDPSVTLLAGEARAVVYATPAPEFEVRRVTLAPGAALELPTGGGPAVLLVTEGRAALTWSDGTTSAGRGASYVLPACLPRISLRSEPGAEVFVSATP
jgi:mannose-6-phosphate isomerase